MTPIDRDAALDALLRSRLVVDPPADVQARLLAVVMSAAAAPDARRSVEGSRSAAAPATPVRALPLLAYVLLGLACALYAGLVGGMVADPSELAWQAVRAAAALFGSPLRWLLSDLLQHAAGYAMWLLLAPLVWYLWESDRSAAPQA